MQTKTKFAGDFLAGSFGNSRQWRRGQKNRKHLRSVGYIPL